MVNVKDTVYYKFHTNNGSNEKHVAYKDSYKQQFLQFLLRLFSIFQFTVSVHYQCSHHALPELQQKAVFIRQKLTVHSP